MRRRASLKPWSRIATLLAVTAAVGAGDRLLVVRGQTTTDAQGLYTRLKTFALSGGSANVTNLVLKRDRIEMTFTGTFYFTSPIENRVTGAVFVGQGTLRAEVPPTPSDFEKDNVRRLLGADVVDSDFKTAVIAMTDDTFDMIGRDRVPGEAAPAPAAAQKLATDLGPRFVAETGVNLAARLALSMLNDEKPGVFAAQFDGGRRSRFSVVFDQQHRIPLTGFNLNAGEKGLVFAYQPAVFGNDIWLAFNAQADYGKPGQVYSDASDLVDVTHYGLDLDLREASRNIVVAATMDMKARVSNVRAVTFSIGESLSGYQDQRLKNQLRLKSVTMGGQPVPAVQEDWEGGFTVFLPRPLQAGEAATLDVKLEGNFMQTHPQIPECFYPISNTDWFPRHGYLDRATFDLTFTHAKRHKIASVGTRVSEAPDPANKDAVVTKYKMDQPIALAVFAVGAFTRVGELATFDKGGEKIPIEFNAVSRNTFSMKDDFVLAELGNAVRYFAFIFGRYPYASFSAAFHPYPFGQGFPSLLMLPPADRGNASTYQFIAHETAHQWWGNIVAWRSYRDQWLSEGFADYSGLLYAGERDKERPQEVADLLRNAREELRLPPQTTVGLGKGRLADIGPIILGHRLNTSKTFGAYQALIYAKGSLVLRMLHFLFSNPTAPVSSAATQPFFVMMGDFVERFRNGSASTDDFFQVAGEHFAKTPIAQRYGIMDLRWFLNQWVYQTALPTYTLTYELKPQPDGKVMIAGTVLQEGVPDSWFMPLPVVLTFAGNQVARTTIRAQGPSSTFELSLPAKPVKIELDPAGWVLAEKMTVRVK